MTRHFSDKSTQNILSYEVQTASFIASFKPSKRGLGTIVARSSATPRGRAKRERSVSSTSLRAAHSERLRGGAASFLAQVLNDKTEPLIHGQLLQDLLPAERVVDEGGGHEIRQHLGVPEVR